MNRFFDFLPFSHVSFQHQDQSIKYVETIQECYESRTVV